MRSYTLLLLKSTCEQQVVVSRSNTEQGLRKINERLSRGGRERV